mmetsp:Transcript_12920/g.23860  ORF Transcript_12920/g.23860 Transcript_12920/m.23860 type:complete len:874 (-) Transcript_12920:124-2745(-)|eukprot:CAMPEP_0114467742 /NCGR_PEP_ID=MMETSP0104-20121206/9791_1 /TAXON_ID=37642 ORGANISM="Paraphysomonas imperforata, Strain PA2" /NCGR_SAMPLE_ID=MMETSP0104 /ASSEMBLY_ACC=CAM_ASM_000202 /LENGTH=873 /DNA_ID=CAMNT_0001641241 /DNA_START=7 /DNA_END=2628 /DNA_ORIENTATION=+
MDHYSASMIKELKWEELHPELNHVPKVGAFGTVFKAKRQIGRDMFTDVAVKALKIHSAGLNRNDYDQAMKELKNEADILQNASNGIINDFVVKFHGIVCGNIPSIWLEKFRHSNFHLPPNSAGDSVPELVALVMKYESGGNLEELLHNSCGRTWHGNTIDRIRLLMEITTGLWHLHNYASHCIIHGDIKSANVLLSGEQGNTNAIHVRLTDFGLSSMNTTAARCSRNSSVIRTSEKRGTWPYMAPEMYARKKQMGCAASRSTDIYALGTLMWEVLCNQRPWAEFCEADRLVDVRMGETLDIDALPLDTPRSIREVLEACLSLDRTERPTVQRVLGVLQEAYEDMLTESFDVFLSYAWGAKDCRKPLTDKLYTALQDAGYRVWMDSIHMDHHMTECMVRGIRSSSVVVALLSHDYIISKQCRFELDTATKLGKERIVCVMDQGFWKDWAVNGVASIPVGGDLCQQLRLTSHLYADFSKTSTVDWASKPDDQSVSSMFEPCAFPRLLKLLESQRRLLTRAPSPVPIDITSDSSLSSSPTTTTPKTTPGTIDVSAPTVVRAVSNDSISLDPSNQSPALPLPSPLPSPLTSSLSSSPRQAHMLNSNVKVYSSLDADNKLLLECGLCFDEFPADTVITCNGPSKHPLCAQCFSGESNLIFQTSPKYRFHFAANDSRIICLFCGAPFSKMQVGRHAGSNFGVYHRACKEVVEELMFRISNMSLADKKLSLREKVESIEQNGSIDLATKGREIDVLRHALYLYDHAFSLKCPKQDCKAEVVSFEGSFVVLCTSCSHFSCGWCNQFHNIDEGVCEIHVKACPKNLQPDHCFGTHDEYLRAHRDQRSETVRKYLDDNVDASLREELIDIISSDLLLQLDMRL